MVAQNNITPVPEDAEPSSEPPQAPGTCVIHMHTCRQNIHIKQINLRKKILIRVLGAAGVMTRQLRALAHIKDPIWVPSTCIACLRVSSAMIKRHADKQLGEERVYFAHTFTSQSIKRPGQEPRGQN